MSASVRRAPPDVPATAYVIGFTAFTLGLVLSLRVWETDCSSAKVAGRGE